MTGLSLFQFEGTKIRVVKKDGNPWWIVGDVCAVLGIKDSSTAASRLDEDERGTVSIGTLGGNQDVLAVSESGLYQLVFTSRKPIAKRFKKWLAHEVVPAIRKTGTYSIASQPEGPQRQLAPQRDLIDYVNAAQILGAMNDPIIRPLLTQRLAEELGAKTTPMNRQILVAVRAGELGISARDIGTGSELGNTSFDADSSPMVKLLMDAMR